MCINSFLKHNVALLNIKITYAVFDKFIFIYYLYSYNSIICRFQDFLLFSFWSTNENFREFSRGISICFDPHFLFLFQFENIPTEKSNKFVIPFGIVLETKVDWIAIVVILLIELLLYIYVQTLIAPSILQTTFYSQLVFSKYRK